MKHAGTHQRKTISTVIKKYILKQYFFLKWDFIYSHMKYISPVIK